MKEIKLHTRFNPARIKNYGKTFDRHDNVDRISYVDNTTMVRRLVLEGKNLAAARAQALRSGLFSMKDTYADDGIPTPVYEMDPAVAAPIVESAKLDLTSRIAERANDDKNDDASRGNSEVTKSSPDSTGAPETSA